jgi:hypothetical protein
MKQNTFKALALVAFVAILAGLYLATPARSRPLGDYSNFDGLIVDGTFGTATPQIVVVPRGGNNAFEVQNTSGTPVVSISSAGALSGFGSSGLSVAPNIVVAAPTGVGTATPVALVNSAGGVSNLLEVRNASTPQVIAYAGGGVSVAAPTAVATARPVLLIQGQGASNQLEIRNAGATPVASFGPDGSPALPASSIDSTEIANVTRNVNVPLGAFIDCQTDAGALIGFDTTADALADYVNSATDGTGFVIRFDDTGSSEDQSSEICSQLKVPADYASGGTFTIRALKDAHTAATEVINCAVSVNGAALETAGTVTTSASATTSYTCTPTIAALAANDSLSFYLSITSDSTMNDVVDLASVAFTYTATQ